jgi:DNA-binding HxlR family transcriptional regulator
MGLRETWRRWFKRPSNDQILAVLTEPLTASGIMRRLDTEVMLFTQLAQMQRDGLVTCTRHELFGQPLYVYECTSAGGTDPLSVRHVAGHELN